jgi:hypothetical protein
MRFRPVLSSLLVAAYLPACTGYQSTAQPLAELTAPPTPVKQVRVTLADGTSVQVTSPHVVADTLRGTEGYQRESGAPVAIPVSRITAVETVPSSNMSGGAKVAIGAAVIGLGALVVVWAQSLGDCGWMCD